MQNAQILSMLRQMITLNNFCFFQDISFKIFMVILHTVMVTWKKYQANKIHDFCFINICITPPKMVMFKSYICPFGSLSPCSLPNTLFYGTGDMMNYDQHTHIVVFIKFSDERSNNTGNNHTSTYIRSVRSAKN